MQREPEAGPTPAVTPEAVGGVVWLGLAVWAAPHMVVFTKPGTFGRAFLGVPQLIGCGVTLPLTAAAAGVGAGIEWLGPANALLCLGWAGQKLASLGSREHRFYLGDTGAVRGETALTAAAVALWAAFGWAVSPAVGAGMAVSAVAARLLRGLVAVRDAAQVARLHDDEIEGRHLLERFRRGR